jgi:pimeloyl-ACP methyl ester carboxylesterase
MNIVDVGTGAPVVIVPGIQGRWEWMKPAVDALRMTCRVITFSLADEPTCGGRFVATTGFDCYVEQIREAMDQAGVQRGCVCGVSYGGLIAAAFAARHADRVSSLMLVSALPPTWTPDARARFYVRSPRLLMPLFLIASLRMYKEIAAARPGVLNGVSAAARHATNALMHLFSPGRMARRVRLLESVDLRQELQTVSVPTLIMTGEAELDRVVPIRLTEEYMRIFPHAERVTLVRTGHLGLITRPREFAAAAGSFVERTVWNGASTNRGDAETRRGDDQVSPRLRVTAVRDVERKRVG